MTTSEAVFELLRLDHVSRHEQLRESTRMWQLASTPEEKEWAANLNCSLSSQMMLLRDIARFMLGIDPEDDGNPFGGPDDF